VSDAPPNRHAVVRPPDAAGIDDRALEEINRLWTVARALTNTAHDVNNALQVIAGSAELLEARELEPAVQRRVETIRHEAAKAAAAISRLLSYARGRMRPPQPQDLRALVLDAIELRRASAARNRIALVLEEADDQPYLALFDDTRTSQAVLDLLLAAESRLARRGNARITARLARVDHFVALFVQAECDSDSVEREEEEDRPSAAAEAFTEGAGLWAANRLAAMQGGSLSSERTGDGLTFVLTLPAADGPAAR
jgi:two-component system, NtrC family, sensor kinase